MIIPIIMIILIVAVALAVCIVPGTWSVTEGSERDHAYFTAFTWAGAHRKAERIARRKGWVGFKVYRHVEWY